jgi:hypothetical protein
MAQAVFVLPSSFSHQCKNLKLPSPYPAHPTHPRLAPIIRALLEVDLAD